MTATSDYELLASDIRRKADFIEAAIPRIRGLCRDAAGLIGPPPSRVYLVGCGDSLNVGMACRFDLERILGLPVEPVPALTFARYTLEAAPPDCLVIALSQSGRVSRVIEVVRRSRARHLRTVALTGYPGTPLAAEPANHVLVTNFESLGFAPGLTAFAFNLVVMFEFGVALAEAWDRGRDVTNRLSEQLEGSPDLLRRSLSRVWQTARVHARGFGRRRPLVVLGTGPNLATAHYMARRLSEIPQLMVMSQETEEYAHDEYSIVTAETPAWVFLPPFAAESRTREILNSLLNLGCPTAVVTNVGVEVDPRVAHIYYLEPGVDEGISPILYALPVDVFTYELVKEVGGSFYATADPTHAADGDPLIYESEITI
jgi:glucosamine--fructose-6-phosphate aminotransferase (isomerizing)